MKKAQIENKIDFIANQLKNNPITKARIAQIAVACRIVADPYNYPFHQELVNKSLDYLASEFKTMSTKTIKQIARVGFSYLYPQNPDYWRLQDKRYLKDIKKMENIFSKC